MRIVSQNKEIVSQNKEIVSEIKKIVSDNKALREEVATLRKGMDMVMDVPEVKKQREKVEATKNLVQYSREWHDFEVR